MTWPWPDPKNTGYQMVKWISVKDSLPPENKKVLIISFYGEMDVKHYVPSVDAWYPDGLTHISHWMELPPPPEPPRTLSAAEINANAVNLLKGQSIAEELKYTNVRIDRACTGFALDDKWMKKK